MVTPHLHAVPVAGEGQCAFKARSFTSSVHPTTESRFEGLSLTYHLHILQLSGSRVHVEHSFRPQQGCRPGEPQRDHHAGQLVAPAREHGRMRVSGIVFSGRSACNAHAVDGRSQWGLGRGRKPTRGASTGRTDELVERFRPWTYPDLTWMYPCADWKNFCAALTAANVILAPSVQFFVCFSRSTSVSRKRVRAIFTGAGRGPSIVEVGGTSWGRERIQAGAATPTFSRTLERIMTASQPTQLPLSQNTHRLLQQLTSFLLSHHRGDVIDLLAAVDQDDERHYSVTCSLTELGAWDAEVASQVVNSAGESMDVFDTALLSVQNELLQELRDPALTVKQHVHARLFGPPGFSSGTRGSSLSSVRSEMLNTLVTVTGTVAKTGVVNVLESRKTFECVSCGYRFAVVVDDLTNDVSLPKQCPSTNASCDSDVFRENQMADKTFTNYQEIQVQEHFSDKINNNKKAVTVVLQDDLAESCQIGQVVHISGIVVRHGALVRSALVHSPVVIVGFLMFLFGCG